MTGILLADREWEVEGKKSHFSSGKLIAFLNEKQRFEIGDFGILSLARLPISPPWPHTIADFRF
jgi:hypothetical protein